MFALVKNMFGEEQMSALADTIQWQAAWQLVCEGRGVVESMRGGTFVCGTELGSFCARVCPVLG